MYLLQDTRTHAIGELYDTERSYVESLQILVTVSTRNSFQMSAIKSDFEQSNPHLRDFFFFFFFQQKYLQPLKGPECSGLVETNLVDEIFYQVCISQS